MCFTQLDPEAPDRRFQFDLVVQPNDTYEGEISTERNARFTPPPASTKHRITLPAISSSPLPPPPLVRPENLAASPNHQTQNSGEHAAPN